MEDHQYYRCDRCGHEVPTASTIMHNLRCQSVAICKLCGKADLPRHELEHLCETCNQSGIVDLSQHKCPHECPHECPLEEKPAAKKACIVCGLTDCENIEYCVQFLGAIRHLIESGISRPRAREVVELWITNGSFQENYNNSLSSLCGRR